jgi:preprotein translocase subunit SecE
MSMAGSSADRLGTVQRSGSKPAKTGGGNPFTRLSVFFRGVRTEMGKVAWPSKEDLKTYTIVVFVSTVLLSVLMGVWDLLLAYLLQQFLLIGA